MGLFSKKKEEPVDVGDEYDFVSKYSQPQAKKPAEANVPVDSAQDSNKSTSSPVAESVKSAQPVEPNSPAQPVQDAQPAPPAQPVEPVPPVQPAEQSQPVIPPVAQEEPLKPEPPIAKQAPPVEKPVTEVKQPETNEVPQTNENVTPMAQPITAEKVTEPVVPVQENVPPPPPKEPEKPAQNLPPLPDEPENQEKKSGSSILPKIILFLGAFLLFFCGILTIAGVFFLRGRHVPFLSGMTEDLYLSDSEQFSMRTEYLADTLLYNLMNDENVTLKTDIDPESVKQIGAEQISDKVKEAPGVEYDSTLVVNYNLPTPILGAIDPGELDGEAITKILESTSGEVTIHTSQSHNLEEENNNSGMTEITFEVPGVNLSTKFENKFVGENFYFFLERFPINEYFDVSMISGQWIKFPINDFTSEDVLSDPIADSLIASLFGFSGMMVPSEIEQEIEVEINQKEYDQFKAVIKSEAFGNLITSSYKETVGTTDTKCYVMSITKENLIALGEEMQVHIPELEDSDIDSLRDEEWPLSKLDIHICFAKLESFPVKLKLEVKDIENTFDIEYTLQLLGLELNDPITEPSESVDYDSIDWDEVFNGLISGTAYQSYSDPMTVDYGDDLYTPDNVCDYYPDTDLCTYCKTGQGKCYSCVNALNAQFDGIQMTIEQIDACGL